MRIVLCLLLLALLAPLAGAQASEELRVEFPHRSQGEPAEFRADHIAQNGSSFLWIWLWNEGDSPLGVRFDVTSEYLGTASANGSRLVLTAREAFVRVGEEPASSAVQMWAPLDAPLGEYRVTLKPYYWRNAKPPPSQPEPWTDRVIGDENGSAPREFPLDPITTTVRVLPPDYGISFELIEPNATYSLDGTGTVGVLVTNADEEATWVGLSHGLPGTGIWYTDAAPFHVPARSTVRWDVPLAPVLEEWMNGTALLDLDLYFKCEPGHLSWQACERRTTVPLAVVDTPLGAAPPLVDLRATLREPALSIEAGATAYVDLTLWDAGGGSGNASVRLADLAPSTVRAAAREIRVDGQVPTAVSFPLDVGADTPPGTYELEVFVEGGAERISLPLQVVVLPAKPVVTWGADVVETDPALGGAIGGVVLVATAVVAARREGVMRAAVVAGLPLYTRLARPTMLDEGRRSALYEAILDTPGIHLSALKARAGVSLGAAVHHLRLLEKHGFVTSRTQGRFRRYFAAGTAPASLAVIPDGPQAEILAMLASGPLTRSEIETRLGLSQQGVSYHVKRMQRAGQVVVRREGSVDTITLP